MPRGVKNPVPPELTLEFLKSVLGYDSITGIFVWKVSRGKRHDRLGVVAGNVGKWGYREISIDINSKRFRVKAHRLAWFYVTGDWPPNDVDHKNLNRDDNSFENLRLARRGQNNMNSLPGKINKSGHKGVCWQERYQKWQAYIRVNGDWLYLGRYISLNEAVAARRSAEIRHFGEFSRAA